MKHYVRTARVLACNEKPELSGVVESRSGHISAARGDLSITNVALRAA